MSGDVTPIAEFVEGDAARLSLTMTRCIECAATWFGSKLRCPRCCGRSFRSEEAASTGSVVSFTTVCRTERGVETPFTSVVVHLDGGGYLKGNLLAAGPAAPNSLGGARVRMVPRVVKRKDSSLLAYGFEVVSKASSREGSEVIDRAKIGSEIEPATIYVERGKIRELARALHDDNPIYFEGERPPAPLTFARISLIWSDNIVRAFQDIGVDLSRILHGGVEFEYGDPIHAGDVLHMTGRLLDVYTKQGSRGGTLEFIVYEWLFHHDDGRLAVRIVNTTIQTSQAATDAAGVGAG